LPLPVSRRCCAAEAGEEWAPDHDRTAAIFLKIGNPNTPYGMDAAESLRDHVAQRVDPHPFLPILFAPKIPHGSEPRCDDTVRYTEWASEVWLPISRSRAMSSG
jgi:hypothetical protein